MNVREKVHFWKTEARQALAVAGDLLKLKHYLEALFFGHLALEKLLKARLVKITRKDPLYTHDLAILAKYSKLKLNDNDLDFLARINVYNIRARYQDYKQSLYKKADREFTAAELLKIREFFRRIE